MGARLGGTFHFERYHSLVVKLFGAGGAFLFGADLTAADVMYAPVVTRFLTWQPEICAETRNYCKAVRGHPLVSAWYDGAAAEPAEWLLPDYEKTP